MVYNTTRICALSDRAGANRYAHANGIGRDLSNLFRPGAADRVALATHSAAPRGTRKDVRATVRDVVLSVCLTVVESPRVDAPWSAYKTLTYG